jgi:hypothetical protein
MGTVNKTSPKGPPIHQAPQLHHPKFPASGPCPKNIIFSQFDIRASRADSPISVSLLSYLQPDKPGSPSQATQPQPPKTTFHLNPRIRRRKQRTKLTTLPLPPLGRPPIRAVIPPLVPLPAALLRHIQRMRGPITRPNRRSRLLPLHDLHGQALACMPRDVAMHEPRSWIVSLEGEHHIPRARKKNDVATRRIVSVDGTL